MGKKSKKSAKKQKPRASAAARGEWKDEPTATGDRAVPPYVKSDLDLLDFLCSGQEGPSAIHGTGFFFNGKFTADVIEKGVRFASSNDKFIEHVYAIRNTNSPLLPPWKELLWGPHDTAMTVICSSDQPKAGNNEEALAAFRQCWLDYVDLERSLAHIFLQYETSNSSMKVKSVSIEIESVLSRGQEMLRAYGNEWIAMKFYHMKGTYIQYSTRAAANKDGSLRYIFVVNQKELSILGALQLENDNLPGSDKEDIFIATLSDIATWADCLEYLADTVGKEDASFRITWSDNLARLQKEFGYTPGENSY